MPSRILIFCGLLFFLPVTAHEVVTWVSPYYINDAKTILNTSYGDIPVKSTITRLGLQFWNISSNGSVNLLHCTDSDVRWFAEWGKQNNIKILLTVINDGSIENGYRGFDWTLVRSACYGSRGDTLLSNLLAEMDKYELAGIDLDLEGEDTQGGPFTIDDNIKYAVFVNKLCDSLHSRDKICTINTYPGNEWGAPKPDWWNSWKGRIDAIHTMGYTSSYWNCPTERSYQGQQNLALEAGIDPQKLLLGMSMWVNNWAGSNSNTGTSNIENLNYILNCLQHQTGIALWDIHTPNSFIEGTNIHPWTADTVWILIKAIHDGLIPDPDKCPSRSVNEKIIDDMSNVGINLQGGVWSAFSDNWSRTEADQINSTRVLTPDGLFDMALQYGSYGDISPGYIWEPSIGQELRSHIKTVNKAGDNAAEGGFVMNFLPVDLSLDTTAESWEVAKVGVEKDLSSFNKMVICLQCTSGKKLLIFLRTREQQAIWDAGYGGYFNCTGNYEDYELPFAALKPIWGNGPKGFDASHSLRLTIEYIDQSPPSEITINIAGVAVDTSVMSIKNHNVNKVEKNKQDQSFYKIRSDGIYFRSLIKTSINLYTIDGRLILNSSLYEDHFNWGSSIPTGVYIIRILYEGKIYSEKVFIIK